MLTENVCPPNQHVLDILNRRCARCGMSQAEIDSEPPQPSSVPAMGCAHVIDSHSQRCIRCQLTAMQIAQEQHPAPRPSPAFGPTLDAVRQYYRRWLQTREAVEFLKAEFTPIELEMIAEAISTPPHNRPAHPEGHNGPLCGYLLAFLHHAILCREVAEKTPARETFAQRMTDYWPKLEHDEKAACRTVAAMLTRSKD